jgi:hypothetical protein
MSAGVHDAREAIRALTAQTRSPLFLATVTAVSGYLVKIRPDGLAVTAGDQLLGTPAGYTPIVGDRVVCAWIDGEPFVLAAVATAVAGGSYLPLSGGTISGLLTIERNTAFSNAFLVRNQSALKTFWISTAYHEAGMISGAKFYGYSDDLITKTYTLDAANGNADFAAVTGKSFNSPVMGSHSDSWVSGSRLQNSTTTYVAAATFSLTLPTGTWEVAALGWLGLYATPGINFLARTSIGGTAGGAETSNISADDFLPITARQLRTGVSGGGSVTINMEFRPSTGGNVISCASSMVMAIARRTA